MQTKIVFIDIDGTLVETSKGIIAPSSIEAIRQLRASGVRCVVCTGRPPVHTREIRAVIEFDAMIHLNGAYVSDLKGNVLFDNPLSEQQVALIWDYAKAHDCGLAFHFNDFTYGYHCYEKVHDFFYNHVREQDTIIKDDPVHERILTGLPYNGVVVAEDEQALIDYVHAHPDLRIDKIREHVFDVFRADNDKARAIKILLDQYGYTFEEAAAIGDSTNDLEMIRTAGIGIAMGNAAEVVKKAADYVTSDVCHDGVANAIAYIMERQTRK